MCDCENCNCGFLQRITPGLGFGLGRLAGLGAVMKAGTPFSQGFQVNTSIFGGRDVELVVSIQNGDFEGCLYKTGAFYDIAISKSGTINAYLQVDGVIASDFGAPEDVTALIAGTLRSCINRADLIEKTYPIAIGQPPPEFRENPQVAQSNYRELFGVPEIRPDKPGACDKEKGLDYVACSLGLKPTQGVYVGVFGALAVFLIFGLVLRK
jgi:hypothetical protein